MKKTHAIKILGGSMRLAAEKIGISYQAVHKWPDTLTPRVSDRVEAALVRNSAVKSKFLTQVSKGAR